VKGSLRVFSSFPSLAVREREREREREGCARERVRSMRIGGGWAEKAKQRDK
jgi:hypothetical protein